MTLILAEKIIRTLDGKGVGYKCLKHRPVRTSEEAAKVLVLSMKKHSGMATCYGKTILDRVFEI